MEDDRMAWKLKRISKKITLSEMQEYVGCTYNMLSMYENGKAMAPDKVEKYYRYIKEKSTIKN